MKVQAYIVDCTQVGCGQVLVGIFHDIVVMEVARTGCPWDGQKYLGVSCVEELLG